jgi:hypothetical protein
MSQSPTDVDYDDVGPIFFYQYESVATIHNCHNFGLFFLITLCLSPASNSQFSTLHLKTLEYCPG